MDTKRQLDLDILRALAIGAVVAIHISGSFLSLQTYLSPQWNFLISLDQIFRFCVPLFVALSGLTLTLRYVDRTLDLRDFYLRRVAKILPLYFLWAAVSYFLSATKPNFWEAFLLGRADYHLYFVPMIFQLYVLFPICLWFVKRFPKIILTATLVFQLWLYQVVFAGGHWSDQEQYFFGGTWIFYFVLGIYLTLNQEWVKSKSNWSRFVWPVLLIIGLVWTHIETFNLIQLPVDPIIATRFTKVSVLVYGSGVILSGFVWGKLFSFLPGVVQNFLGYIGKNSYFIYLAHVVIWRIIFEFISPRGNPGSTTLAIITVLVAVFISLGGSKIYHLLILRH